MREMYSWAASRKPPVPQAGSQIVIPGSGRITSTIARISGRGVKYWPAPDFTSSAFLCKQPLVGVALDVGVERHPLLAVDQVDDQPPQLRRVLDPVLRLAEDDAEHPGSRPSSVEHVPVVDLQLVAVAREQARPVEPVGDERGPVERRLRLLVGHLQEEQVGELLEVVAVREPVVAQDVAVVPEPLDEAVLRAHAGTLRRLRVAWRALLRSPRSAQAAPRPAHRPGPAGRARQRRPAQGSSGGATLQRR